MYDDKEFFDNPTKILTLTRNEAIYIDDSLTMMLETSQGEGMFSTMRPMIATAQLPAPVDLIEKIAIAVLYTIDKENDGMEAEVSVSEGDLYCLRELAQSYVCVGGEQVGYNLKLKIYNSLYGTEYHDTQQLKDVLGTFTPNKKSVPILDDEI